MPKTEKGVTQIYKVEHGCGFGPYQTLYAASKKTAEKLFKEMVHAAKKKENYDKEYGMKFSEGSEFDETILSQASFQTWSESNTESGQEFYEDMEFVTISLIDVLG